MRVVHGSERAAPDLALNCALITWQTNRAISDTAPVQYLKERADQASMGDEALLNRLRSHAIPYGPLAAGDYEAFLLERAELLEIAMKRLAAGEAWSRHTTAVAAS